MIEELSLKLLDIIFDMLPTDAYKIIEFKDIFEFFDEEALPDIDNVTKAANFLKEQSFVNIKFFDEEEICICITSRGRRKIEDERYEKRRREIEEKERLERERREEEERLAKIKREQEEKEHQERLAEEKRRAAEEIERMIEETKQNMKKMSRQERQEATKTITELESSEVYKEVFVAPEEPETVLENNKIEPAIPQQVVASNNTIFATRLDDDALKLIRKMCRKSAFYGSIFGGIISAVIYLVVTFIIK